MIYKIVKQIPSDTDKYYVKYNKKSKMWKRKNNESIDEINQVEKKRKNTQGILPKKKRKKIKVEIKTEIKPPKPLPPPVIKKPLKQLNEK